MYAVDFQSFLCRTLLLLCLVTKSTTTFQCVDAFLVSTPIRYGQSSIPFQTYQRSNTYSNKKVIVRTTSLNLINTQQATQATYHDDDNNNNQNSWRQQRVGIQILNRYEENEMGGASTNNSSSSGRRRSRLGKWITVLSFGTFIWAGNVGHGRTMAFSLVLATTTLYRRMRKSDSNHLDYLGSSSSCLPEFVKRSRKNSNPSMAKTLANSYRTQSWVEDRLHSVEAVHRHKQEQLRAQEAEREARRMEQARKWATASLQSNENALKKAKLGQFQTEEDKRKAQLWVNNAAKTGKIELGDSTANGSTQKKFEDLEPWELNFIEEEKRRKQLWVQNAARGSGVQLGGGRNPSIARANNNKNAGPLLVSDADTVDFNSTDEEKRKQLWIQNAAKGTGIELGKNDEDKRKQEWIQKAAKARGVELGRTKLPRTDDSF
mmetsp:Transcript_9027/g.12849  ORF Transcript_9027/g.12849 Transcript_9027/m.12849 type:complete len:433 (-) Transcript_9027:1369-2667(-)